MATGMYIIKHTVAIMLINNSPSQGVYIYLSMHWSWSVPLSLVIILSLSLQCSIALLKIGSSYERWNDIGIIKQNNPNIKGENKIIYKNFLNINL